MKKSLIYVSVRTFYILTIIQIFILTPYLYISKFSVFQANDGSPLLINYGVLVTH